MILLGNCNDVVALCAAIKYFMCMISAIKDKCNYHTCEGVFK